MSQDVSPPPSSGNAGLAPAISLPKDKPVMIVASALSRLGDNRELLRDMAAFFLEDSDQLLRDLQASLDSNDTERARRHAHSLKGLAANFSADPCAEAAYVVEDASRKGDANTARAYLGRLQAEVIRLKDALGREVLN